VESLLSIQETEDSLVQQKMCEKKGRRMGGGRAKKGSTQKPKLQEEREKRRLRLLCLTVGRILAG